MARAIRQCLSGKAGALKKQEFQQVLVILKHICNMHLDWIQQNDTVVLIFVLGMTEVTVQPSAATPASVTVWSDWSDNQVKSG